MRVTSFLCLCVWWTCPHCTLFELFVYADFVFLHDDVLRDVWQVHLIRALMWDGGLVLFAGSLYLDLVFRVVMFAQSS